jgi:hypothetical protein
MDPATMETFWMATARIPQQPEPVSTPTSNILAPRQLLYSPPSTPHTGAVPFTTPFTFLEVETPESGVNPSLSQKRPRHNSHANHSHVNNENIPPTPSLPRKRARIADSSTPSISGRQPRRTDDEKMKNVLNTIRDQGWTLGAFLFKLFQAKDENDTQRSNQHAQMVSKFLRGDGDCTPSDIIACWMKSPYGVVASGSRESEEMYSTTIPYTAIRSVRPALTSFALQTVGEHLTRGAETAVQSSSGLHVSRKSQDVTKCLQWARLGSETISVVGGILESHLGAAFYLLDLIARRKPRKRDGIQLLPRKSRPSRGVSNCFDSDHSYLIV